VFFVMMTAKLRANGWDVNKFGCTSDQGRSAEPEAAPQRSAYL
jgi:hypothetical protein